MASNQSVEFFETQFQKQVAASDYVLNPFERATLEFVRRHVLDLGCGLGNLDIEAAKRGASIVAVDASPTAIARLRRAATDGGLRIEPVLADLENYPITGTFDTVVAIGTLMFFRRARALALLEDIKRAVVPGGRAIVNTLIEGTTFMGMFQPGNYYLFDRNELEERFKDWTILLCRHESFEAPGGTTKEFCTIVAEKRKQPISNDACR